MKILSSIVALIVIIVIVNCAFVVKEGQSALLLQFGRIEGFGTDKGADYGPGLHCVEVEAPNDDVAELVRVAAEERAYRLGAVIEFVDRF